MERLWPLDKVYFKPETVVTWVEEEGEALEMLLK